jgi:HAD superfamily hydrolase (TIGR01509 family)
MTRRLQALIFDSDGTLADNEEVHRQAFNLAFAAAGLAWDWSPEQYTELLAISGGKERITRFAKRVDPVRAAQPAFAEFVRQLHEDKTRRYAALLREGGVRLRPGVERVLQEARREGLTLAIATSSAWSNLKTLLDANLPQEWPTWFSAIETADTVTVKKPSPAVYEAVLKRIGLPADQCLALEDTENGLRAATAAGITTIITPHQYTAAGDFGAAAAVLDGLGDHAHPTSVLAGPPSESHLIDLHYLARLLEPLAEPALRMRQGELRYG